MTTSEKLEISASFASEPDYTLAKFGAESSLPILVAHFCLFIVWSDIDTFEVGLCLLIPFGRRNRRGRGRHDETKESQLSAYGLSATRRRSNEHVLIGIVQRIENLEVRKSTIRFYPYKAPAHYK